MTTTTPSTWKSTTAGIASLFTGVCSMIVAFGLLLGGLVLGGAFGIVEQAFLPMVGSLVLFGFGAVISFALGAIAIWGGIETLQRRSFGWAIAGSVVTMITFFPVGMLAVVLVILSEDEIRGTVSPPPLAAVA